MSRKVDPTRKRRGTGHRAKAGEVKVAKDVETIRLVDGAEPPEPPADLEHPHARAVWRAVVAELWPRGLKAVDLEAVRLLSSQAGLAYEAAHGERGWQRSGLVVESARGVPVVNPMIRVERDAATLYLRFAERFGLDVASRMRLGLLQLAGQTLADALQDDLERE